jgi:hypothetical protein
MKDNCTMTLIRRFKYELIVVLIWGVAVASKILYNGLVFGFDYGTYQPDGKFYTYMALDFLHQNPQKSAQLVVDWYLENGFKMNTFTIQDLMPSTSYAYPIISHRILYPLLSVPFVAMFGITGMLAVPALALLAMLISVQILAKKFNVQLIGLILVVILSTSPTVLRWMIINCTDSLLAGLFALVPICLIKINEKRVVWFFPITALVLLTSATRFILPLWFAVCTVMFFRTMYKKEFFGLAVLSFVSALPALTSQISTALLPGEVSTSTASKILILPISFVRVVSIDVLQLAVLDRILLITLTIALLLSFRTIRKISSQMYFAALLSTYLIGAINGTLGVNFRYQMPVLIFCAWVFLESFEVTNGSLRLVTPAKRHIKIDKAQNQLKA